MEKINEREKAQQNVKTAKVVFTVLVKLKSKINYIVIAIAVVIALVVGFNIASNNNNQSITEDKTMQEMLDITQNSISDISNIDTEDTSGSDMASVASDQTYSSTTTTTAPDENEINETTEITTDDVIEGETITKKVWETHSGKWTEEKFNGFISSSIELDETDLIYSKTATTSTGKDTVSVGDTITYTITVTNNSENELNSLYVIDDIPEKTKFVSSDGLGQAIVNEEGEVTRIIWNLWNLNLAKGESIELTMEVIVAEGVAGAIKNVAIVEGNETEEIISQIIDKEEEDEFLETDEENLEEDDKDTEIETPDEEKTEDEKPSTETENPDEENPDEENQDEENQDEENPDEENPDEDTQEEDTYNITTLKTVSCDEEHKISEENGVLTVSEGALLTYTIELTNNSTNIAKTVIVKDDIPKGTTLYSITDDGENNNETITWKVNLEAGETKKVSFTVKVTGNSETIETEVAESEETSVISTETVDSGHMEGPSGDSTQSGSSSYTVDHIDVAIEGTASVYDSLGDLHKNINISITEKQIKAATVTAQYEDGTEFTNFTYGTKYSTGSFSSEGKSQWTISGSYPIGTYTSPIYYTVTTEATVTVTNSKGVTEEITVIITGTISYWDTENNKCPGLGSNWDGKTFMKAAGMDVELGGANSKTGVLYIQKNITGITLEEDMTYTFLITGPNDYSKECEITVKAGETSAIIWITDLEFGTYSVTETNGKIEGYTLSTTYKANSENTSNITLSNGDTTYSGTILVTNTYEEEQNENEEEEQQIGYIYNIAYVYDENGEDLVATTTKIEILVITTDVAAYSEKEETAKSTQLVTSTYVNNNDSKNETTENEKSVENNIKDNSETIEYNATQKNETNIINKIKTKFKSLISIFKTGI